MKALQCFNTTKNHLKASRLTITHRIVEKCIPNYFINNQTKQSSYPHLSQYLAIAEDSQYQYNDAGKITSSSRTESWQVLDKFIEIISAIHIENKIVDELFNCMASFKDSRYYDTYDYQEKYLVDLHTCIKSAIQNHQLYLYLNKIIDSIEKQAVDDFIENIFTGLLKQMRSSTGNSLFGRNSKLFSVFLAKHATREMKGGKAVVQISDEKKLYKYLDDSLMSADKRKDLLAISSECDNNTRQYCSDKNLLVDSTQGSPEKRNACYQHIMQEYCTAVTERISSRDYSADSIDDTISSISQIQSEFYDKLVENDQLPLIERFNKAAANIILDKIIAVHRQNQQKTDQQRLAPPKTIIVTPRDFVENTMLAEGKVQCRFDHTQPWYTVTLDEDKKEIAEVDHFDPSDSHIACRLLLSTHYHAFLHNKFNSLDAIKQYLNSTTENQENAKFGYYFVKYANNIKTNPDTLKSRDLIQKMLGDGSTEDAIDYIFYNPFLHSFMIDSNTSVFSIKSKWKSVAANKHAYKTKTQVPTTHSLNGINRHIYVYEENDRMNDLLSLQYTDTVLSGTKSSYSSDERLQELSGKNLANLVVQDIQQAVDNNHDLQFHCNAGANRAPTQALGMLIASNQLDMLNVAHIGMCAAITTDTTRSPFTTMQPLNIHTLLYIAAFIKAGYVIDHNRLLKFKEIMNDSDLQECSRWHGY